jgi:hypothetical protein
VLLVATSAGACGPIGPTELYGLWGNLDAGTWRVFEFSETLDDPDLAGSSPAYRVYVFEEATEATVVQRGGYDVVEDVLVTSVVWAEDAAQVGQTYGNAIVRLSRSVLVLEVTSTADGQRSFDALDQIP